MKEITLAARTENIDAVTEFVNQELEAMGCPGKTRVQFDVAIDEIFANIACYAYGPEGGAATVRFEALESPRGAPAKRGSGRDPLCGGPPGGRTGDLSCEEGHGSGALRTPERKQHSSDRKVFLTAPPGRNGNTGERNRHKWKM